MWRPVLLCVALLLHASTSQVLTPSQVTISHQKPIRASSTCGELNGQPINEVYCSLTGSSQYTPLNQYSYSEDRYHELLREYRNPRELFIQGGHGCSHCMAGTVNQHPAEFMVDGNTSWWQSPPLSRGKQYNEVNITIDLEQEFHVAYVWIQMANSPKPGAWVLERSTDHGETFKPWFYFAENNAECMRKFGPETLAPLSEDEQVICRTDMASIQPLEDAEMVINLLENRPSRQSFASSSSLQNFTRATNVRLRLLGTRTFQGHLMDVKRHHDPSITRRYFYAIKEVYIGGRCVCNGHASTCDVLDVRRPKTLLCRCEHNTCGDMCERCCPGFEQKKWQKTTATNNFTCEPCNCFGRSEDCVYDEELDAQNLSLDIHGNYEGGGRCQNCRENTQGINCNECRVGFFKPEGVDWKDANPCRPCVCDPNKHTGACDAGTGKCQCQPRFEGEECDRCAPGYYDPPECKACECAVNGTKDAACLPTDGHCPCLDGFGGQFCETCAPGFTNISAGCMACQCNDVGSIHSNCSAETGQCACKSEFSGLACDECAQGYFGFPKCTYCNCDPSGTEDGICDATNGQCLCKPGFAGERCDQCDVAHFGYPACKPCECTGSGAKTPECDIKTGDCLCMANYTGRACDKCAAGFYDYPNCKACGCLLEGAKGQTCDNNGQCYCKGNFEGERCDRCKPNFYNYPVCEECNCHPSGVTPNFGGCDKVAPGELCSCRAHVSGRICDQCKPTFWDLQYHHPDGCVSCDCNLAGTLSMLNSCDQKAGQCVCKRHVGGRACDKCAEGYYNMHSFNQLGCEPCNCDMGGSLRSECDAKTGQCKCRPRVAGEKCDKPIDNHYFPTLWHNMYEAEDGRSIENRPVRFASDAAQFANFSWRGYAVFSPIQDKIILDADVSKASMYKVLLRYHNPTTVPIQAIVALAPAWTNTHDIEQSEKVTFPPTTEPQTMAVTVSGKPFVLNPGKWAVSIATKQRLFLDYIVLLPQEYYEGTILKERVPSPCKALSQHNTTCLDLLYPPIDVAVARADATDGMPFTEIAEDGTEKELERVPIEILPALIGPAAFVRADNKSRIVKARLEVPEDGEYVVLVEYFNQEETALPLQVELMQNNISKLDGTAIIQHCPFAVFCRELVTAGGRVPEVQLEKGVADVQFSVDPMHEFGLAAVSIIPKDKWNNDFLQQFPVCTRKDGKCVAQQYPPAQNSITSEAEEGNQDKALTGDKLPFPIVNPQSVTVVPIDQNEQTEISGVVPQRGHYRFIVNYFNPDNTPLSLPVLLQNTDHLYQAVLPLEYCPSVAGCRAVIHEQDRPMINQFWMEEKYTILLSHNTSDRPVYIDSVTAVPYADYNENLMKPQPIDLSQEFVEWCGYNHLENPSCNVSDFCRDKIFTLTTDFNQAALSCDCVAAGSLSFACDAYGGQCQCKPNIIGRRCDKCAPGHYQYPDCLKCKCGPNQQCDEQTGQCFCPPHVEGTQCDRCVPQAFGYDPLIGCQLCGCSREGSEDGALQCDPLTGQCLCKEAVGGRKCDRCLSGFYAFPACYSCQCNPAGTTEEICDPSTAACKCKENVYGRMCDACKPGTFDLSTKTPEGCKGCFCFGVTGSCRSSDYPVLLLGFDSEGFDSTDPNGTVVLNEGVVTYKPGNETAPETVYFIVPLVKDKDHTGSYGLNIHIKLAVYPPEDGRSMNTEPDLRLLGSNMTAEFWSPEQPSDPSEPFTFDVPIVPENFLFPDGKSFTRADLMYLLYNLEDIHVKGSYFNNPSAVDLMEFSMEVSSDQYRNTVTPLKVAAAVEQCECPAPYIGPSCQDCAPGYYRVKTGNSMRDLGSCVPCDCNGHSGTCNPETGVCSNCQHNTYGDNCEFCEEGYYGDASTGGFYACQSCQCPFVSPNNFAFGCTASIYGEMLSCDCKDGYTGVNCERCDSGFFGEPTVPGGTCERCECNGNNNLTDPRACHPLTGECYLCEQNTDGRHCDTCAQWYYGDAIVEKNCKECSCDKCGSHYCDSNNGTCTCKPNVEGDTCDKCVPDHFGFSQCRGCLPCHCGAASSISQCHEETGQCACRSGASGLRCERCEHGYWNYTQNGCEKCDCEADLSMGTVCDVLTGQCHCQEGATGPRCDQCLPSYLRIPTLGCRRCDECVHHLKNDVDNLGGSIDDLGTAISGISAATVSGARLSRSNKTLNNIRDVSSMINAFLNENLADGFYGNSKMVVSNVTALTNSANRAQQMMNDDVERVNNLTQRAIEVHHDIKDRIEVATWVVDDMKNLAANIGSNSKALEIKPEWISEAKETLNTLQSVSVERPAKIDDVDMEHSKIKEKLGEITSKVNAHKDRIDGTLKNVSEVQDFLSASEFQLKETNKAVNNVNRKAKSLSLFHVESLAAGINTDFEKTNVALDGLENVTKQTKDELEALASHGTEIDKQLVRVNESRGALSELNIEKTVEILRMKRDTEQSKKDPIPLVNEAKQKSNNLSDYASTLSGTFAAARTDSENAVEAANAYQSIADALQGTKNTADSVTKSVSDEQLGLDELKKSIDDSRKRTEEVKSKAAESGSRGVEELNTQNEELKKKANGVKEQLANLKGRSEAITQSMKENVFDRSSVENLDKKVAELAEKTELLKESAASDKDELKKNSELAEQASKEAAKMRSGQKQSKKNLDKLVEMIPAVINKYENATKVRSERTQKIDAVLEKLAALKEKIEVVRDAVNRVRLGARFSKGSSLDLRLPHRVSRSAAYTDIGFNFKTSEDNGIPLFFGNEEGSAGTRAVPTDDYIAVEIEEGRPKVSVNLGNGPNSIHLDTVVTDDQWRKIRVERIGKAATVTLSMPNSEEMAERKTSVANGNKSVLNLHQELSKLFVGGIPRSSRISRDLRNRDFVGEIESLELHGTPIALWNTRPKGIVQVTGSRNARMEGTKQTEGVSLDGDGYIIYNLEKWNPRQKTNFALSFLTYSPDGVLFYIGNEPDFLVLELSNGNVKLSLDLGTGVGVFESEGKGYNDGQWHSVVVHRLEKHVRLEIDSQKVAEGDSPGTMTELSISEHFYIGGLPTDLSVRTAVEPLKGCIREVELDNQLIDLQAARARKGVSNACTADVVREVSLLSDRASASFHNIPANDSVEVTLKFKSNKEKGTLFTITTDENEPVLDVTFADGVLAAAINGHEKVELELASASDAQWHYVSVRRDKNVLRMDVDDLYSTEVPREPSDDIVNNGDKTSDDKLRILFGKHTHGDFIGCIGDVTFNGKLLDFAKSTAKEVQLTGCSLPADVIIPTQTPLKQPTTPAPTQVPETDVPISEETTIEKKVELPTEAPRPETTAKTVGVPRADGACMLLRDPLGVRPDSEGTRYGLYPNSRLEFASSPDSFDKSGTFSVQLRATGSNGVIVFATDKKDHIGVLLVNGRVVFSFNTGSGQVTIASNRSVLDDEWHTVKAYRNGNGGTLQVDDELVEVAAADQDSSGTDSVDTIPPLYLGGVPADHTKFLASVAPGVKTEFSGCLRDLKLNDKKFDSPSETVGTVPCSEFIEPGMFFGGAGGYVVLHKEYTVGIVFTAEFEIRPRTQNAVLLSVGVMEYLNVQLIDGNVHFTMEAGDGPLTVTYKPHQKNALCDGHWHTIKLTKKKNLITLTVDGKSNLKLIEKGKQTEVVTKDDIYLGGIPEGVTNQGIETKEPYVGCLRVISFGTKREKIRRRMKKHLDTSSMDFYGDVNKKECPVN